MCETLHGLSKKKTEAYIEALSRLSELGIQDKPDAERIREIAGDDDLEDMCLEAFGILLLEKSDAAMKFLLEQVRAAPVGLSWRIRKSIVYL